MGYDNLPDDNSAPYSYVPPEDDATWYRCPNADCIGNFYLYGYELGQRQKCPKCGLSVTIGKPSLFLNPVLAVLFGIIVGFFVSWACLIATHPARP